MMYSVVENARYIPVRQRLLNERNVFIRETTKQQEGCTYSDTLYPHPYLAHVHHALPPCGLSHVNNVGLFGPDYPYEKDPEHFVVLLTGGSVAAQLATLSTEQRKYLEEFLNRDFVSPNGKPFLILNGGDGAWKYPHQTILFLLYADVVDAVITLDGFNEHYLIGTNVRLEYPSSNFLTVNPLVTRSYAELGRMWLSNKLYEYALNSWFLSHSNLGYATVRILRSRLAVDDFKQVEESRRTVFRSQFRLPETWSEEKRIEHSLRQYKKYIRIIRSVAEKFDILSCHFLQPVPALYKSLTDEEKKVVGDLGYASKYSRLERELTTLSEEGIPLFSLLKTFENVEDTVYQDEIHYKRTDNGESLGNRLIAEQMISVLASVWRLKRRSA